MDGVEALDLGRLIESLNSFEMKTEDMLVICRRLETVDSMSEPFNPEFANFESRLASFPKFLGKYVNTDQLARYGFYNCEMALKCFHCDVSYSMVEGISTEGLAVLKIGLSERIMLEHHVKHGECHYIREVLGEQQYVRIMKDFAPTNMSGVGRVRNWGMRNLQSRLETFHEFQCDCQETYKMALCGLYVTDEAAAMPDTVRCFCCDLGIQSWKNDDNPYLEHARWAADCEYIKRLFGVYYCSLARTMQRRQDEIDQEATAAEEQALFGAEVDPPPPEPDLELTRSQMTTLTDMGFSTATIISGTREYLLKKNKVARKLKVEELVNVMLAYSEEMAKQEAANKGKKTLNHLLTDHSDAESMLEQNKYLRLCRKCAECDESTAVMFLPCKHSPYCKECNEKRIRNLKCPICSTPITKRIKFNF